MLYAFNFSDKSNFLGCLRCYWKKTQEETCFIPTSPRDSWSNDGFGQTCYPSAYANKQNGTHVLVVRLNRFCENLDEKQSLPGGWKVTTTWIHLSPEVYSIKIKHI